MKTTTTITSALMLCLVAGAAQGQTALGNGRGLEADLSGRGVGNVPRPDFMAEVRLRNDLVTGNATGGRSFRGSAGYKSGDEFRGSLGSDDLFSYRRDSLSSGAAGLGYRGTSSLQYQYSYATANQFNGGQSTLSSLGGSTSRSKLEPMPLTTARTPRHVSSDSFSGVGDGWTTLGPKLGTLRSTATFNSIASLNPTVLGERTTAGGKEWMTASSLLGMRATTKARRSDVDETSGALPPGALNRSTGGERLNRPASTPTDRKLEESTRPGETKETEVRTSYADVLDRLDATSKAKAKDGGKTDETADWQERIKQLREQLNAPADDAKGGPAEKQTKPEADQTKSDQSKAKGSTLDPATLELIRLGGGDVSAYTLNSVEKDLYSRYMTDGAASLAKGRYFDAEEQFARCLAISPGDPMASAARINAQLGAALFLSAAVNLHALLEKHPEVAGVRYTGATMPSPERLSNVAQVLRDRIAKAREEKSPVPEESAFLLAYVGFQLKDAAVLAEGFADLDASAAASGPNAAMLTLVKGVWKLP